MSKLDDFLNLSDVEDIKKDVVVMVNGQELTFTIRALTEDEHSSFQRRSNNISKNKVTFDSGKYNDLVLTACIVEPNFSDETFLKKVKCETPIQFLHKKFPAGALTEIAQQIQVLSGFETFEMEVESAKN